MKDKIEKTNHSTTSTTVRVKANAGIFSCLFFCVRNTDTDVIDPAPQLQDKQKESSIKPV